MAYDDKSVSITRYGQEFKGVAKLGSPLAQVFSIVVDSNDNEEWQIYGTIKVVDCRGSFYTYDVAKEDADCFTHTIELDLWEEPRVICADSGFSIVFDLKDRIRGDAQFMSTEFCWAVTDPLESLLVANVKGCFDSTARVEYVVFGCAVEANIWAEFYPQDKNKHSSGIHLGGSIVGRYHYMYSDDLVIDKGDANRNYEITLFDDQVTERRDFYLFSFKRRLVALPIAYAFSIDVNLNVVDDNGGTTNITGQVKYIPESASNGYYLDLRSECGILKFGYCGFSYFFDNAEVTKKQLRESGFLLT